MLINMCGQMTTRIENVHFEKLSLRLRTWLEMKIIQASSLDGLHSCKATTYPHAYDWMGRESYLKRFELMAENNS